MKKAHKVKTYALCDLSGCIGVTYVEKIKYYEINCLTTHLSV